MAWAMSSEQGSLWLTNELQAGKVTDIQYMLLKLCYAWSRDAKYLMNELMNEYE